MITLKSLVMCLWIIGLQVILFVRDVKLNLNNKNNETLSRRFCRSVLFGSIGIWFHHVILWITNYVVSVAMLMFTDTEEESIVCIYDEIIRIYKRYKYKYISIYI